MACTNGYPIATVPFPPFQECIIYENKKDSPKRGFNWLRYIFACVFCLILAAFIVFLVLFILAISGGLGPVKGRMLADLEPNTFNKLLPKIFASSYVNLPKKNQLKYQNIYRNTENIVKKILKQQT